MSIDMTQQALNALAAAGLGNDSPAEAYVIGYAQGHDDALALAIRIEQTITATPLTPDEIERRLRTAGFTRPQAGSIMDAEQSDELAEAYEQCKQAVFDAMNHFDELAIVERANPYRKDGR